MTKVIVVVVDVMSETLFDLAAKDALDRPALLGIDGYAHWGLCVCLRLCCLLLLLLLLLVLFECVCMR